MSSVTCPTCKGIYKNQNSLRNHRHRMHLGKKTNRTVYLDKRSREIYEKELSQHSKQIRKLNDENFEPKKVIVQLQQLHGLKTIFDVEHDDEVKRIKLQRRVNSGNLTVDELLHHIFSKYPI